MIADLDLRKVAAARLWATEQLPYLAAALFAMQPVACTGLGTAAVDAAWRLYLDPAKVAEWSTTELGAVLVHEVQHLLRDHAERADVLKVTSERSQLWNVCADAEINDDLRDDGVVLPEDLIYPETIGMRPGRLAEEYYATLTRGPGSAGSDAATVGSGTRGGKTGKGGAGSRSRPSSSTSGRTSRTGRRSAKSAGTPPSAPVSVECGSGVDGLPRPWDQPSRSDGPAAVSPPDAELIRRQVAVEIVNASRSRGDVPAGLQRWASELVEPRVDWRRLLASELRRGVAAAAGGGVDYSYARPSRRQAAYPDIVLPVLRRPVPRVAVVVDTSGSMSDEMLGQALGEVQGILRQIGLGRERLPVLACDAAVHTVSRVSSATRVSLAGGGGTDMGVGIVAASQLRPCPQLVVVLTDGYTPWPLEPPGGIRVVAGILSESYGDPKVLANVPHWARAIAISEAP